MKNKKTCPLGNECTQNCMWSIWVCGVNGYAKAAACALAVLAARGTDDSVNMIPIAKKRDNEQ